MRSIWIVVAVMAAYVVSPSVGSACPAPVKAAIAKAYPESKIVRCARTKEDGKVVYEALIKTSAGKSLELDVTPQGSLLQTEETVALDAVPPAVMQGLETRFPKAQATRAVKQTAANGKVSYEMAFRLGKAKKEATFSEDGTLLEEE
jgi:hypothetical protein